MVKVHIDSNMTEEEMIKKLATFLKELHNKDNNPNLDPPNYDSWLGRKIVKIEKN